MMRGGGMRLRTWLSNKGFLIALVVSRNWRGR